MNSIFNSSRGFSLAELIISMSISGVVVLGTMQIMADVDQQNTLMEKTFWLNARRSEIQNLIRNDVSWARIVAANPDLLCFEASSTGDCLAFAAPNPPRTLRIPIGDGVLDGSNAQQGISNRGDLCTDFDETDGDNSCPIGVTAHWEALCDDELCKRAQPKIMVTFREKRPSTPLVVLKSFNLTAFRDPKLQSVNAACEAMGGTMPGNFCTLSVLSTQCDPASGLFVLGFDALGRAICGKPLIDSCLPSDVATGFTPSGGIACTAACL